MGGILGDNLGEGNCGSKIVSRQWGDNFCREASRCLAGPSGWEFHDRLREALSGNTSKNRGVPSRFGGESILEMLWSIQMSWIIGLWGIPAVLPRGIPAKVLRAFPWNFSGISSGKSQPYLGREVFHGVGADGVGVKFPIFAVNCCCLPLSFRRSGEKRRKRGKMRRKRGKCEEKGEKRAKKGENHSDPIYTNPIKNLPIGVWPGKRSSQPSLHSRWIHLREQRLPSGSPINCALPCSAPFHVVKACKLRSVIPGALLPIFQLLHPYSNFFELIRIRHDITVTLQYLFGIS